MRYVTTVLVLLVVCAQDECKGQAGQPPVQVQVQKVFSYQVGIQYPLSLKDSNRISVQDTAAIMRVSMEKKPKAARKEAAQFLKENKGTQRMVLLNLMLGQAFQGAEHEARLKAQEKHIESHCRFINALRMLFMGPSRLERELQREPRRGEIIEIPFELKPQQP